MSKESYYFCEKGGAGGMIEELHSKDSFLLLWETCVQSRWADYAGDFTIMNFSVFNKTEVKHSRYPGAR